MQGLRIISPKKYTVQVEVLQEMILDFTQAGISRTKFEKLPFVEKVKYIQKYGYFSIDNFSQITDIEIKSKIENEYEN